MKRVKGVPGVPEFMSPDDPVWCNLCDPPYATSLAMLAIHMRDLHAILPEAIADAEIIDTTGEEESS